MISFLKEKNKTQFLESLSGKLKEFSLFLGDNEYFSGDRVSFYISLLIFEGC